MTVLRRPSILMRPHPHCCAPTQLKYNARVLFRPSVVQAMPVLGGLHHQYFRMQVSDRDTYPHEIDIQKTHTKHRKLDSQATLSHQARGRAPDGLRAQSLLTAPIFGSTGTACWWCGL